MSNRVHNNINCPQELSVSDDKYFLKSGSMRVVDALPLHEGSSAEIFRGKFCQELMVQNGRLDVHVRLLRCYFREINANKVLDPRFETRHDLTTKQISVSCNCNSNSNTSD